MLHEEGDHDDTGRYTTSRYILDPSACVERFTHTPSRHAPTGTVDHDDSTAPDTDATDDTTLDRDDDSAPTGQARPVAHSAVDDNVSTDQAESSTQAGSGPCTSSWDTDPGTVSQSVGHRELGHNNKEVVVLEEQHRAREGPPTDPAVGRLVAAGVAATRATALADRHPPDRVVDVLDAVSTQVVDNPAGWIVTALDHDWDIGDLAEQARQKRRRRDSAARQQAARRRAERATSHQVRQQQAHSRGWANVAAAVLDDQQLTGLVERLVNPTLPAATRSVRLTTAQVTGWVAAACHHRPDRDPKHALAQALAEPDGIEPLERLPPPPDTPPQSATLDQRIATVLRDTDGPHRTDRDSPTTSHSPRAAPQAA